MSDRATVYTYDDNGNLIKMVAPDKSALYVYDANNRLIKATVQDGTNVIVEEYTYDFAGNRTSKATTTDSGFDFTKYVLDTNSSLTQVLAELNADKTEKAYYTRGTDLISQERDGKISYYLYDGHGSVRQLADENGSVTDTYDYDAFGNLTNSTGSTANNYRYCGEQYDGTTGLYYLRARYMNPNTGTFISMDSYAGSIFEPVSLHKYLYCGINPVSYCDPSGHDFSLTGTQIATIGFGIVAVGLMAYNEGMRNIGMTLINDLRSNIDSCTNSLSNQLKEFANTASSVDIGYEIKRWIEGVVWFPIPESTGIGVETFPTTEPTSIGAETFPTPVPSGTGVETFPSPTPNKPFTETFPLPLPLLPFVLASNNSKMTTKEATAAATELGYQRVIGQYSHGQPIYYNSKTKTYITPDIDSHNGGKWKMAKSIPGLLSKGTRLGTYDENLNRIGD
jgi:RHS repeat-associated protein